MDVYTDYFMMLLEQAAVGVVSILVIGSIVLFVIDGINAKKENRKRKLWITIAFVISLIVLVLFFIGVAIMVLAFIMYPLLYAFA
jgi:Na+/melibiose symporter-like transporter